MLFSVKSASSVPTSRLIQRQSRCRHVSRPALGSSSIGDSLLTEESEIRKLITENDLVVVDFMAKWCRKCIVLRPKVERLHAEFPSIRFLYVDVNEVPYSVMQDFGIEAMPTLVLMQGGREVARMKGGEEVKAAVDHLKQLITENFKLQPQGPAV